MFIDQIAIVSETKQVRPRELMRVTAALQKQVMRDFEPIWSTRATIDSFEVLEDVPLGYWPIIIRDDIGFPGAAGIHLDEDGQPFALVQSSSQWPLTASHETLEMLADPFGMRLVASQSVAPGQGRVEYLVEVCDPSEAADFGYTVNGILMSDFYTPQYFDPVTVGGVRYSFTGAISKPREVLRGGYLSWHNPVDNHWYQMLYFNSQPEIVDIGVFDEPENSLRSWIDSKTYRPVAERVYMGAKALAQSTKERSSVLPASTVSKAKRLRTQIDALRTRGARGGTRSRSTRGLVRK